MLLHILSLFHPYTLLCTLVMLHVRAALAYFVGGEKVDILSIAFLTDSYILKGAFVSILGDRWKALP